MIWADRVGVVWAGIVALLFAWAITTQPIWPNITDALVIALAAIIPWLGLRGIDWIASGGFRWHPTPPHGKSL